MVAGPGSGARYVPLPSRSYLEDSFPHPGEEGPGLGRGGGDREWQQLGLGQQGPEPSNTRRGLEHFLPAESESPEGLQVETDFGRDVSGLRPPKSIPRWRAKR